MKYLIIWLCCILSKPLSGQNILQYRAVLLLVEPKQGAGPAELAIRSFVRDTQHMYLLVHPDSVYTHLVRAKDFHITAVDWNTLYQRWKNKPYIKALLEARQNDAQLQDAGIIHIDDQKPGISLTADLCPSQLPLDRRVFTALIKTAGNTERPIPISLSVSGTWMQTHKSDLAWLKDLVAKGDLYITWTNHTLHHHWNKGLPLSVNFLLERGTDLTTEVLGNEELMMENGLLPSCFFRFPGLVSDKEIVDQILSWGLVPIGSDAWLAKGQNPKAAGSIVLIHANGNEPIGVNDFLHLLHHEKTALQHGQWRLLDLREEIQKD